jgi:hypothetical protein
MQADLSVAPSVNRDSETAIRASSLGECSELAQNSQLFVNDPVDALKVSGVNIRRYLSWGSGNLAEAWHHQHDRVGLFAVSG